MAGESLLPQAPRNGRRRHLLHVEGDTETDDVRGVVENLGNSASHHVTSSVHGADVPFRHVIKGSDPGVTELGPEHPEISADGRRQFLGEPRHVLPEVRGRVEPCRRDRELVERILLRLEELRIVHCGVVPGTTTRRSDHLGTHGRPVRIGRRWDHDADTHGRSHLLRGSRRTPLGRRSTARPLRHKILRLERSASYCEGQRTHPTTP